MNRYVRIAVFVLDACPLGALSAIKHRTPPKKSKGLTNFNSIISATAALELARHAFYVV